jgi:hypothetical protein
MDREAEMKDKSNLLTEDVRFISTFKNFDDEASGRKPYIIRDFFMLPDAKKDKIERFIAGGNVLIVTISRGYTSRCIRHTVTHAFLWKNEYGDVIIAWNPNEVTLYAR